MAIPFKNSRLAMGHNNTSLWPPTSLRQDGSIAIANIIARIFIARISKNIIFRLDPTWENLHNAVTEEDALTVKDGLVRLLTAAKRPEAARLVEYFNRTRAIEAIADSLGAYLPAAPPISLERPVGQMPAQMPSLPDAAPDTSVSASPQALIETEADTAAADTVRTIGP